MRGEIVFDNVSFGYEDGMVLEAHLVPRAGRARRSPSSGRPARGKSTLTQLINRTYDVTDGRILIDGVDVREWSLASLRSQISNIEQDVFLFSRTMAENIAFGAPGATQEQIEQAAREAQAHDFIMSFAEGYQTEVGERGVTLSGGQRQRIALARAFLSDPRILILDDSTSAIDSATEDEIQKAIRRAQAGPHHAADHAPPVADSLGGSYPGAGTGQVIAAGTHESCCARRRSYRRIFARYDAALPPLEVVEESASERIRSR